ncbi:MAG TPA: lycopene cyclase domain-containing protein [Protaetiibacter sp.]|nr:lycopene cyclase domain-containing protein [Protaetiibacter sp.]
MSYILLASTLLAVALAVRLVGELVLRRRGERIPLPPTVLAAVVLTVLTLVFDNLMIAAGLFSYADAHISGLKLGLVPIEDLSYPLALAIALPAVWRLLPRGERRVDA